jgi:hypothetical protein
MRPHDYSPRPAHIKWLLDSDPTIRWQVMSDLIDETLRRLRSSDLASQPKAVGSPASQAPIPCRLLGREPPNGWRGDLPKEDRDLLITLYSLAVLMDLGLDSASKDPRRIIERDVDKRLVFKRLNNRSYLRGETEPCINGRILGIGSYGGME